MHRFVSLFLSFLSICLIVQVVSALKCYICNSGDPKQGGDACLNENLSKDWIKDCDIEHPDTDTDGFNYTMCRKITQWIDNDYGDGLKANTRTIRTCGREPTDRDCYYRAGFGGRQQVCTCNTDSCNGGVTVSVGATAILAPILALLCSRMF